MSAIQPSSPSHAHAWPATGSGQSTSAYGDVDDHAHGGPAQKQAHRARGSWRIGLFWYTFGLLTLLLAGSALVGYWLLREIDNEPRIRENARQIVSLVNLTRAAMQYAAQEQRPAFIGALARQEYLRVLPRTPGDRVEPFDSSDWARRLSAGLRDGLGAETRVARSVNGQPGLWIGFTVGGAAWWLWLDASRAGHSAEGGEWLLWSLMLAVVSLVSAALLAQLVNRPLKALAAAAAQVHEGNYTGSHLSETVRQAEVRAVNVRFNRMAEQLARGEQERAQMLAGISHDLRTPLARLRLEVELGVSDKEVREHMASDIEQVSATLNKFLDYVRPNRNGNMRVVNLSQVLRRCVQPFNLREHMAVQVDVSDRFYVVADAVELARVIANLLENAYRYGQTPGTGFTHVQMNATIRYGWVRLRVRDYGAGVPEEQIDQLTRPFYRGDAARQNAVGTGLGLTIAARMIGVMGGKLKFANAGGGGLSALIYLQLAAGPGWAWGERRDRRKG